MKRLTGKERLDYRKLFENVVQSLVPLFKIVFLCNDLPNLSEVDYSVLRRIFVIPFPATFLENHGPSDPRQCEIDRTLETTLKKTESKEAMLLFMAQGAQ
jgi:phage/plasmid-associated DNA primase